MKNYHEGEEYIMTTGIFLELFACVIYSDSELLNRIQLIKMWIICTLILVHFVILYVLFAHPLIVTKELLKYNIN